MTVNNRFCCIFAELQLKSEHKPIQHLNDWKRKIVGLLTDSDPSREDPQIFWRRDAILSIVEEKDVSVITVCIMHRISPDLPNGAFWLLFVIRRLLPIRRSVMKLEL